MGAGAVSETVTCGVASAVGGSGAGGGVADGGEGAGGAVDAGGDMRAARGGSKDSGST